MGKYINFGKYNKNYNYIILTCVFIILQIYLPNILLEIFLYYKQINIHTKNLYNNHNIMLENLRFFGMLIFSFIIYIYEKKSSKSESNIGKSNASRSEKGCFKAIKNNNEKNNNNNKIRLNLNILIITTISLIIYFLEEIISALSIFSNWMIFLLIVSYINSKMFKLVTYKHQKLAMYFNLITSFIFQLSSFILAMIYREALYEKENIYIKNNFRLWLFLSGLIILFVYVYISAYTFSKIKWFMDLKQVSLTKLLMIYSLLGIFINIIYCAILTYIKCEGGMGKYLCKILDNDNNLYFENIFLFFNNISNIYRENIIYLIIIIFIIFVDMILYSLYNFLFYLVLKNLNPEFYIFADFITQAFIDIIEVFIYKIKESNKILLIKFFLSIIGYFLGFIGFLVYSEIIELNFCGLNYNLRRKIIGRSIEDSIRKMTCTDDQIESLINDNTFKIELSNNQ